MSRILSRLLLVILYSCQSYPLIAQDYIAYQRIFNRVDQDVLRKDYETANHRLDSIYRNYHFIYANHCFKALQINGLIQDSVRAAMWLERCFLQGVPLWIIRNNGLTQQVYRFQTTQVSLSRYDSLRKQYLARRNDTIRRVIDRLYKADQKRTNKVNNGYLLLQPFYGLRWIIHNNRQFRIIRKITERYGFPGERLIGVQDDYFQDSTVAYRQMQLTGPCIGDERAFVMLLHYYSQPHRDINGLLENSVRNGFLPPRHYAAIGDFMAIWGRKKHGDYPYFNQWHTDPDENHISAIDARRAAIGLMPYATLKACRDTVRNRMKQKTTGSRVIVE